MKSAQAFDRRVFGRRQTNIRANVRIGYQVVACSIKDISEGGALLEFDEPVDLPARVRLSWPDQPNEVVCEVRHVRRKSAGVQFTRPQALSLKPTVTPAEVFKSASSASTATDNRPGASANSLVAERRRNLHQTLAPTSPSAAPAPARGDHVRQASETLEPPRDLSALKASLQAAAMVIVAEREARRVPGPMAAIHLSGAPVKPPSLAAAGAAPHPFVMTRGASLPPAAAQCAKMGPVPRPLAAKSYGMQDKTVPTSGPVLLTGLHAASKAQPADCHRRALSVWRRIALLAPGPLPARAYQPSGGTKVA